MGRATGVALAESSAAQAARAQSQRYCAFVSYRHLPRDRHWAMRIMRRLEDFRVPAGLRAQGFPDRVGTLFRDEDEIPASNDLSDQIREALRHSDFLIVICSPETPASRWVRREIELFHELGKSDKIFPVLIDGTPEQSFPPELFRRRRERLNADGTSELYWEDVEPIAADIRPREDEKLARTEERAVLRLVAALIGCRYDDLVQRDRARRRSRLQFAAAAAGAFLISAVLSGLWYWDAHVRTKAGFFVAYGEKWGVPYGIGEIDDATARAQYVVYRLTRRGGRVVEMARENGSRGYRDEAESLYENESWNAKTARWVLRYHEDNTLAYVTQFDAVGRIVRRLAYEIDTGRRSGLVRFERAIGIADRQMADGTSLGALSSNSDGNRAEIGQHRLRFDADGQVAARRFEPLGGGGMLGDSIGSYGRAYDYGANGRIRSVRNTDANGAVLVERSGVAEMRMHYDAVGRLMVAEWRSREGAPATNGQGFATARIVRDNLGRVVALRFEAADGGLVLRRDYGIAEGRWKLDARGNRAELAFFDVNGKPMLRKEWGVAGAAWTHNEQGRPTEISYVGLDGKPALNDEGIARQVSRFDERGRETEWSNFGIDGKPVTHKENGVHRRVFSFDESGNIIEIANYGVDGRAVLSRDRGAARETWSYDEQRNALTRASFGTDGKPVLNRHHGVAGYRWRYDMRGNLVQETYVGTDGKPALRKDLGAAQLVQHYDTRGNLTEQIYLDAEGRPALNKSKGAARETLSYDERGNLIRRLFFGADGKPILNRDHGVAGYVYRRDARGNMTEEAYVGLDGKPAVRKDIGSARMTLVYDERGNRTEAAFFDVDGDPVLNRDEGAARETWTFDERGSIVSRRFFGLDGAPVLNRDHAVAGYLFARDSRGNMIEEAYVDVDGKPSVREDIGVARRRMVFDERGNKTVEAYFDARDRPVLSKASGSARQVWSYDERGHVLTHSFFGVDGEPVLNRSHGVAGYISIYDARGNKTEESFVGTDGNLAERKDLGVARLVWRFDDRGNETELTYYGVNGAPKGRHGSKIAIIRSSYDAFDGLVEQRHYDAAGKILVSESERRNAEETRKRQRTAVKEATRSARYTEAVQLQEELCTAIESDETAHDGKPGDGTAGALGELSWQALFARDFVKAQSAAERALSINAGLLWIETNRAHALLFLGREDEARALYLAHKGRRMPDSPGMVWEHVIIEDFNILRAAGIQHAQIPRLIELLRVQ